MASAGRAYAVWACVRTVQYVCVIGPSVPFSVKATICTVVVLVDRFCIALPMGVAGCKRLGCHPFQDLVIIVSKRVRSASPDRVTTLKSQQRNRNHTHS